MGDRKLLLAFALVCACAAEPSSESLTLSTSYPAPSGVYQAVVTTGGSPSSPVNTVLARDAGSVLVGPTGAPGTTLDRTGNITATGNVTVSGSVRVNGTSPGAPVPNTLYNGNIVKGWVTFDGLTGVILNSYNVASVNFCPSNTPNGTYCVNWATPFADANYAVMGMCGDNIFNNDCVVINDQVPPATGSIRIKTLRMGAVFTQDFPWVSVIAIGAQ